eukprot:scaffold148248_cov31-Tisochrysis_lutea.AAC.7
MLAYTHHVHVYVQPLRDILAIASRKSSAFFNNVIKRAYMRTASGWTESAASDHIGVAREGR